MTVRAPLILMALVFLATAGALLALRPVAALVVFMLLGAVATTRTTRKARSRSRPEARPRPVVETPRPVEARPEPAVAADPVLLERVRGAGWAVRPAERGAPWFVAVKDEVRVAVRPSPRGPRPGDEDIAEALAAKMSENARYAAIVSSHRPDDPVAQRAREAQIHIVSPARLEAYLTTAASFQQPAPSPQRVPA